MAPKAAVDTSAFIAAVCAWHEKHAATLALLEDLLDQKTQLLISSHALLESYAVLTRLPPPHRLAPADAFAVIDRNLGLFQEAGDPGSVRRLLREWSGAAVAGGRVYDRYILEAARAAGATSFVTLNPRDVEGAEPSLKIVVP